MESLEGKPGDSEEGERKKNARDEPRRNPCSVHKVPRLRSSL